MKRLKFLLILAASGSAIALVVYPATLSAADGKPTIIAITNDEQSFDFRAGRACSFELAGTPVSNNESVKIFPADANGDVREIITGTLKEQLANVGTGKPIVVNVSGPATEIVHPDGSADVSLQGSVPICLHRPIQPEGPAHVHPHWTHGTLDRRRFHPDVLSTTDKNPLDVCAALS